LVICPITSTFPRLTTCPRQLKQIQLEKRRKSEQPMNNVRQLQFATIPLWQTSTSVYILNSLASRIVVTGVVQRCRVELPRVNHGT
jgi:hypothetical protein